MMRCALLLELMDMIFQIGRGVVSRQLTEEYIIPWLLTLYGVQVLWSILHLMQLFTPVLTDVTHI